MSVLKKGDGTVRPLSVYSLLLKESSVRWDEIAPEKKKNWHSNFFLKHFQKGEISFVIIWRWASQQIFISALIRRTKVIHRVALWMQIVVDLICTDMLKLENHFGVNMYIY